MSCGVSAETLEKAGKAVLNVVYALEKQGYRVQLKLFPKFAERDGFFSACSVVLKQYGQPLNIQKLSFPLTSVSMFRRLGFRWLETVPDLKGSWYGYGCSVQRIDEIKKRLKECKAYDENSIVLNPDYIEDFGFNAELIIDEFMKRGGKNA